MSNRFFYLILYSFKKLIYQYNLNDPAALKYLASGEHNYNTSFLIRAIVRLIRFDFKIPSDLDTTDLLKCKELLLDFDFRAFYYVSPRYWFNKRNDYAVESQLVNGLLDEVKDIIKLGNPGCIMFYFYTSIIIR